jgi:MraZ protein
MDECILVYPQDEWDKVKGVLSNYNVFNAEQRYFMREFLFFVNECDIDSQNRILLPAQLTEFAHVKKEVIVLGMLDKIEIWDPETKKSYDEKRYGTYEDIAQKVSETILNKKFDIQT